MRRMRIMLRYQDENTDVFVVARVKYDKLAKIAKVLQV